MRRRESIQPRDIARAAKKAGAKMRSISGGRPDLIHGVATKALGDGRYEFRRDDWGTVVYLENQPANANIPCPMRLPAYCEGGSVQRMYLRWRPFPIVVDSISGEIAAVVTRDWICWGGNFQRTFSWTHPDDAPALSDAAPLGFVPGLTRRGNLRVDDYQPENPNLQGVWRAGSDDNLGGVAILRPGLGSGSTYDLAAILESVNGWAPEGLEIYATCLLDGQLYVDVRWRGYRPDEPEEGDEGDESETLQYYCWLMAFGFVQPGGLVHRWTQLTFLESDYDGARTQIGDTVVTPHYAVSLVPAPASDGFSTAYLVARNRETGGIVHSEGLLFTPITMDGQVPLGASERGYPVLYASADGTRLYLSSVEGQVFCYSLTPGMGPGTGFALLWATEASNDRRLSILALTDSSVLCQYDHQLYDTYIDQTARATAGGEEGITTVERRDRAAGLSFVRGVVGLSLATGANLVETPFPGAIPAPPVQGARIEEWEETERELSPYGPRDFRWTYLANEGEWRRDSLPSPYETSWNSYLIPRYHNADVLLGQSTWPDEGSSLTDDEKSAELRAMWPTAVGNNFDFYAPDSPAPQEEHHFRDGFLSSTGGPNSLYGHQLAEAEILNGLRGRVAAGWRVAADSVHLEWPERGIKLAASPLPQADGPDVTPGWGKLSYTSKRLDDFASYEPHFQAVQWLGHDRPRGPEPTPSDPAVGHPDWDWWGLDEEFPVVPHRDRPEGLRRNPSFNEVSEHFEDAQNYASGNANQDFQHRFTAAAGEVFRIVRRFVFRRFLYLETQQTPVPPHQLGPTCWTGRVAVLPPLTRLLGETHAIRWRAHLASGALSWERELPSVGSQTVLVGVTIATAAGIHTFVRVGNANVGRCITLAESDGEILRDDVCPVELVERGSVYDGYRKQFVAQLGNNRWGRP